MADQTNIEWCDSTFNPWTGCMAVSPGCDGCYAEAWSKRAGPKVGKWGSGMPRVRTTAANWRKPVQWNASTFVRCAQCGHRCDLQDFKDQVSGWTMCPICSCSDYHGARRRVFCASLADVFDNEVPAQWRLDLLDLIRTTPSLDWLLLTKRIGNARSMLAECLALAQEQMSRMQSEQGLASWLEDWVDGEPPANVWLGATVVNQPEYDRDIGKLLAVPAAVRFLSMEPLLGPVGLRFELLGHWNLLAIKSNQPWAASALHWVIVGGESGPKARPMHPEWVAQLRNQCEAATVPMLFKQWGEWMPEAAMSHAMRMQDDGRWSTVLVKLDGSTHTTGLEDNTPYDASDVRLVRVGKKRAGRVLDGRTHDGFPEVHRA